ncbi:MAG: ATP-binding protein, partial [Nitrospirota bacterium]|nr:ATP-binding protein [Nitrospirota bacterium]
MSQSSTTNRPRVPEGAHPVYTGKYLLPTPPLARLCDDIRRWLDMRAPGAMVEGPQRFGKTRSVRFSIKELKHIYGDNFPVFSFDCRDYRFPSDSVFFGDILDDLGHGMSRSGTATARRARLIQYLCHRAAETDHRRLVLIADEAQKLREFHYKWLVDLYNELERKDITPTMILVGQPELVHQRDA